MWASPESHNNKTKHDKLHFVYEITYTSELSITADDRKSRRSFQFKHTHLISTQENMHEQNLNRKSKVPRPALKHVHVSYYANILIAPDLLCLYKHENC